MRPIRLRYHLAIAAITGAAIGAAAQAGESMHENTRAGLDKLGHEMSTCAAYFSLLSSIVEKADGPAERIETARRIKSTGQAMLVQSINVAGHIGMGDQVVMDRVQAAMTEMVRSINDDPPNSLTMMYTKYGVPCDELLQRAPKRFADLVQSERDDF